MIHNKLLIMIFYEKKRNQKEAFLVYSPEAVVSGLTCSNHGSIIMPKMFE